MAANFSYSNLRDKLKSLSQREQVMLLVAVVVVIYFMVDALVFAPQARREQALLDNQKALQTQMTVLSAEIVAVEKALKADTLAEKQAELSQLKKQAAVLDSVVQSVSVDVPKLRPLVAELLRSKTTRVKAVSLKTVAVKPLGTQTKPQSTVAGANAGTGASVASLSPGAVHKYGLDIELKGSYLDLMAFLANVEAANPNLLWSNAKLTAGQYPENTMLVSVFLLSTRSNL